jgi:NADP-dependent 3-hydroxy acid dehydrogenase YdfG
MNTPVVLFRGALTGIGHASARAFAHEGARIVVSGRRDETGQALAKELRALGAEAEYVQADVRHEDDIRSLRDAECFVQAFPEIAGSNLRALLADPKMSDSQFNYALR